MTLAGETCFQFVAGNDAGPGVCLWECVCLCVCSKKTIVLTSCLLVCYTVKQLFFAVFKDVQNLEQHVIWYEP